MDSLTQIALGAAFGELVAGRKIGYKAALWGGIAGTIPDLDVLFGLILDPVDYLHIHRGFTHSVFFSAIAAPLLALIAHRFHQKSTDLSFKRWFLLFYLALLTHPILDLFTGYGTQFLYPITDYAFEFNSIFIIDPLYTLPLIITIIMALRLPIGDMRRTKYARLGLIISTSYLILTVGLKWAAIPTFKAELDRQEIAYERMMTIPGPFNSILWRALVETETGYFQGTYSLLDSRGSKIEFTYLPRNEHKIEHIRETRAIQRLLWFSKGYYHVNERNGELHFNDLRFGSYNSWMDDHSTFIFAFRIDQNPGEPVTFEQVQLPVDVQWSDFRDLLARTLGRNDPAEKDYVHHPPRNSGNTIMQREIIW